MQSKRRKRRTDNATPDLTPMIDVTFQLLIFFILCARFSPEERKFEMELPGREGLRDEQSPPREQLTIYCNWDTEQQSNSFSIAVDARGRKFVEGSFARLSELVVFPSDSANSMAVKRSRYTEIHSRLTEAITSYQQRSGADIEKFEISFSVNATQGAQSGTAPWLFVTLALDATAQINKLRDKRQEAALPVTFKFADAMGTYTR